MAGSPRSTRRFGANALAAGACAAAALSTLAYGLGTGFAVLLIARLVWGAAYGVLNLTNMAYAYGDGKGAGKRMGVNRAVGTLGPMFALGAGGWLVTLIGPQHVFVLYGLIGLHRRAAGHAAAAAARRRRRARSTRRAIAGFRRRSTSCSS